MIAVEKMANTAVAGALASTGSTAASGASPAAPFSSLLQSMVQQSQALNAQATSTVSGLLNGQGVEIHDALIKTQKASLAFELALQVRNKAIAAYQQMAGMQF
jgi:flagellar hook-basal body complex protein FliE